MLIGQGLLGLVVFLSLAWLFSENRRSIDTKAIMLALGLQFTLAILFSKFPLLTAGLSSLSGVVDALKQATQAGTQFVFGYLGGGQVPFVLDPSNGHNTFIFALQALPMIMVVSAVSMLLFYWGILPVIVKGASFIFQRVLRLGGALGVVAGAKVLLGNIDAPLLIRPYLKDFSRSELFTVMTCGMATTSATVMVLYSDILKDTVVNPIAHILTASIISIPAAIAISRVMVPDLGDKKTEGDLVLPYRFTSWMDAVAKGTSDGLNIFLNIIAMLIVILALVSLTNALLSILPDVAGAPISLQRIFSLIFWPICWLMGIPVAEIGVASTLMGSKTVMNEVVAFIGLAKLEAGQLSALSAVIMTYALCGFANFSAVGVTIGGLGAMVPERRDEIVSLGLKSVFSGTLATCMSATIIGLISRLF